MPTNLSPKLLTRRQLVKQAICSLPLLISLNPAMVWASSKAKELSFYHTHTGEKLRITYAKNNTYLPKALNQINHYLRDFRTGEVHNIDPAVLDILYNVQKMTGNSSGVFEVISGYRSPKTNSKLHGAKRSLHMTGRAIDVRLSGTKTSQLRDISIAMKHGGTGFYQKSDFVHLDNGRVRRW